MREAAPTTAAALIAVALMSAAAITQAQPQEQPQAPTPRPADGQVRIVVEKMCCKGCAQKVSGKLYTVKGVKSVGVDLPSRTVTVSVPQTNAPTLGALWRAAQQGDGGPTVLTTGSATYKLVPPATAEEAERVRKMGATQHVVIDNLHCQGCARKIASRLYTLKGVTRVSVDMERETLVVQARPGAPLSPWLAIDAVAKAEERPVAVSGSFGTLSIEYAAPAAPKNHQALQTTTGGIQR